MIADCLDVTSVIRLSAVCTSWFSTIRTRYPPHPPLNTDRPVPWLLLSARNSKTKPDFITNLTFYDLGTATSYSVPIPIPSLCDHHWLGSYKGWPVTTDKQSQLHLIKPLDGAHIMLPPINNIGQPKKAVLCCASDCAIINELHVFCLTDQWSMLVTKVGDAIWTKCSSHIRDILSFQGKVYALDLGCVHCYDPRNGISMPEIAVYWALPLNFTSYLLERRGQLVVVLMEKFNSVPLKNHTPRLVKLYTDRYHHGSRIMNLEDDALFLGENSSYAFSTVGHDDIKANCIYFSDQVASPFDDHGKDKFGVFNLRNGTYTPCSPQGTPTHSPLPIWFWPC